MKSNNLYKFCKKFKFNNSTSKKKKFKNLKGVLPLDLDKTNYIKKSSKLHRVHN